MARPGLLWLEQTETKKMKRRGQPTPMGKTVLAQRCTSRTHGREEEDIRRSLAVSRTGSAGSPSWLTSSWSVFNVLEEFVSMRLS
jgi:hypothetical protein